MVLVALMFVNYEYFHKQTHAKAYHLYVEQHDNKLEGAKVKVISLEFINFWMFWHQLEIQFLWVNLIDMI